jgi:2-haloacid dehalogenase
MKTSLAMAGAVMFDLLTALLDSWTVWNDAADGDTAAGRRWRMTYLQLTYGQGAYAPYEDLVRQAATQCGLPGAWADALDARWSTLTPWPGVANALKALQALPQPPRLGIATNCSERLGHVAAGCVGVHFDVVVTSERTGFYKPHPAPYELALKELGVPKERCLFVAGSGYDLFGTQRVGLRTVWHNVSGLARPDGAPPAWREVNTLNDLSGHYTQHLAESLKP